MTLDLTTDYISLLCACLNRFSLHITWQCSQTQPWSSDERNLEFPYSYFPLPYLFLDTKWKCYLTSERNVTWLQNYAQSTKSTNLGFGFKRQNTIRGWSLEWSIAKGFEKSCKRLSGDTQLQKTAANTKGTWKKAQIALDVNCKRPAN